MDDLIEVFEAEVSEMTADGGNLVPLDPVFVGEITEGDDDPRFATFIIESGWSKSKRLWSPELFGKVVSEINSAAASEPLVGFMGHIRPEDDPYTFPEIQLQWCGAKLLQMGEKAKLAVKAYVLPGTKAREYMGKKKPLVRTVSWRGKAAQVPFHDGNQQGVKITDFHIESIDLARPRSAGMSAKLVGALTSEMEEGGKEVKPEEIAALQPNELRAHAPALVASIEDEAKKPLETKISEMEAAAAATKPALDLIPDLRKLLKLDDDADEISVIQSALNYFKAEGKKLRETVLDSVLAKRFKGGSDNDKALVRRLLVGEMESRDVKITGDEEKDEKAVSEMVTEIVDGDSSLKELVSEMENAPPAPPTTGDRQQQDGEWKPGYESTNVRVKAHA